MENIISNWRKENTSAAKECFDLNIVLYLDKAQCIFPERGEYFELIPDFDDAEKMSDYSLKGEEFELPVFLLAKVNNELNYSKVIERYVPDLQDFLEQKNEKNLMEYVLATVRKVKKTRRIKQKIFVKVNKKMLFNE